MPESATLYVSVGPNPRLVRMYLAEKAIPLDEVHVDLVGGENRQAGYLAMNPGGQMPAMRLASGQVIAETLAICEYVEELRPDPPLYGATPEARGETRMCLRRIENLFVRPMIDAYRYGIGHDRFKDRMRLIPAASDDLTALAHDGLEWIEANMAAPFVLGNRITVADLMLHAFLDFAYERKVMEHDPAHVRLADHMAMMTDRPSARQTRVYSYTGRRD